MALSLSGQRSAVSGQRSRLSSLFSSEGNHFSWMRPTRALRLDGVTTLKFVEIGPTPSQYNKEGHQRRDMWTHMDSYLTT
jgi:hypothetical protein